MAWVLASCLSMELEVVTISGNFEAFLLLLSVCNQVEGI